MATPSRAKILKIIGCDHLALYKGDGYWYFQFDDFEATQRFGDRSVYTMYLSDMTLEQWVEEGKWLVAEMEAMKGFRPGSFIETIRNTP